MSALLERAKAHYQDKPRREITIAEWGEPGKPAVITWTDLTVNDQDRIYAPEKGASPTGGVIRIRAVLLKACDAEGRKLFDGMAEHDLRYSVDGDIVGRIANAILYGVVDAKGVTKSAEEQVEDAKNV